MLNTTNFPQSEHQRRIIMAGTVSDMIDGLIVGLIILILVAFPGFIENATGGKCAVTKKIGRQFTKILNRGGINNG